MQPTSEAAGRQSGPPRSALVNIHTFILECSACSVPHPCALSALELFFCDFSAARPCPRADPPSPRPSRRASEVARSRLRGLPHAPRSQPCFFTTTSLLGSSYSPAVTLFFFCLFLVFDHDYRVTACIHRHNTGRTSRIATLLCCLSVVASMVVILIRLYWHGGDTAKMGHFVVSADYFGSEDSYPLNLPALTTLAQRIGTIL